MVARVAELENTTTKRKAQLRWIAKMIATLDRTLHLTKVRVSFARKASGKIKMDSQIVTIVRPENTMTKRKAQKSLIVTIATLDLTLLAKVRV